MSHDLRALSRHWFDQVWNAGREEVIEQLCPPDALVHGLGEAGRDVRGPAGFRTFYDLFKRAFSDIHVAVEDVLVEGDKSVVRIVAALTHSGDGLGIPPTGRRVRVSGLIMMRWKDGKIVESWNEFDAAGMMAQLTGPPPVQLRA